MNSESPAPPKRRGVGRPFKPGQSGNIAGRPGIISHLKTYLRGILAEPHESDATQSRLRVAVLKLLADKPEVALAYAYGRPAESVEVSAAGDQNPEERIRIIRQKLFGLEVVASIESAK